MRILLIHQYYKTPAQGGGIRSFYIARYLADQGHQVEVITAFNEPKYRLSIDGNIRIHYLPIYYTNHLSFLSRIHAFARYVWKTIGLIKKLKKADLHYVISTPLTTGLIALYAKKRYGVPYVFEVGDLWPDAPIQLGVIRNSILKNIAYRLERIVYNRAKHIVALSPDIKENILTKTSTYVDVITNFADIELFKPTEHEGGIFTVGYLGTIGLANHLEYFLDVAEKCQEQQNLQFLIMGAGAQLEKIEKEAAHRRLKNLIFKPAGGLLDVRDELKRVDAVYISFEDVPVLATGSPNKFFDGLAAGKLIVINFKGWIKELVEQHQCGFYHNPHKPDGFIKRLIPYLEDRELLKSAQTKARSLAEKQFDKSVQLPKLLDVTNK